jgi:hypothetical protein
LDLNERQSLLGKVFGQPGRDSGGLGEVPSVSEQIVQADLQALGARGTPQGSGIIPPEYPETGESGLQRSTGGPAGSDRVVTEAVCSALGRLPGVTRMRGEVKGAAATEDELPIHGSWRRWSSRRRIWRI